jgi:hypothetical protein
MIPKEIPSKWESLYGDWCKICRHEKTERCKECSINEQPCSMSEDWTQINHPLSPKDYFTLLFHQCFHCIYLETKFSQEGLWIRKTNPSEICQYEEKTMPPQDENDNE